MKLTLICDQTQDAAAGRLFDRALKNIGKEDVLILTPENATLWAEETLASLSPKGAVSALTVTNISRLCSSIFPQVNFASPRFSVMLISRAAEMQKLVAYKKSSQKVGFASEIYELIKLFSQSGIAPEKISTNSSSCALNQKLTDLKNIWQTYLSLLPKEMNDPSEKLKLISVAAKNGYFKNKTIYFAGYDDISEGAIQLIEQICESAKEIVVSVVESSNKKTVNSSLCDEFLTIAQHANAETVWDRKTTASTKASHIVNNLFAKTKSAAEVNSINVTKCQNIRGESEQVAIEINKLITEGRRFKDIEIVVPNLEKYQKYLESEFEKNNISYFFDTPKSIQNHPLTKLVDGYFSAISAKASVKDLISLNKNVLLNNNYDELCDFENFCLKYGIEYADFSGALKVGKGDAEYDVCQSVHNKIAAQIKDFPKSSETVVSVINKLKSFLDKNNIEESVNEFASRQTTEEEKEISMRIYTEVQTLLGEMEVALSDEVLSFSTIKEIWQNGAKESKLKLVPPTIDCVKVTDVSTSKHSQKPIIIVMGAAQGTFPSLLAGSGLLSDGEIEEMQQQYKLKVGPTVAHVNMLEKFKVSELFALAKDELIITYSAKIGQEEMQESDCVKSLRSICLHKNNPIPLQLSAPQDNLQMRQKLILKAQTIEGAKRVVAFGLSRTKTNQTMSGILDIIGSAKAALEKTNNLKKLNETDNYNLKEKLFFRNEKTSISEIESFFACPYMHFVRYGLGVKDNDEASIRALDIGNFLHKCLEKMTQIFIDHNFILTNEEFTASMKKVLAEIVKAEKYQAKVNALQLEALKKEACRLCYAVLDGFSKTGFKPVAAELVFGKGGALPAIKFTKTKVTLEGKIDRMDTCENMVRLIDYKTGQIDLSIDNLYYGKKVQLFAYLLSVMQDGKYHPAGVFYLPIRSSFKKNSNMLEAYKLQGYFCGNENVVFNLDQELSLENPKSALIDCSLSTSKENRLAGKKVIKPQAHILNENELEKLSEYAKQLIENAICEIENGEIRPLPLSKSGAKSCEYCPFFAVCKIAQNPEQIRYAKEKLNISQFIGEN